MILYRITSKVYARDLSGTGAMIHGGRWNPKGIRVLYTSQSLSLATLEVIVNISEEKINPFLYCVELEFPDDLPIGDIDNLPDDWSAYPYKNGTIEVGRDFIESGALCLRVPSAVIHSEYNYLINPLHDNFMQVKFLDARPFILDKRLV